MSKESLALIEPTLSATSGWDLAEEEPEFEFYLRCTRVPDARFPHNEWRAAHLVEGGGELSDTQRRYMAAVLIGSADMVRGHAALPEGHVVRMVAEAREARRRLRVAMDQMFNTTSALVDEKGVSFAAQALGLKEHQVRHLLKSRRLELRENNV